MAILTKAFARRLAQHARHARTASTLADQRADEPQLWRGTSTVGDTTKLYINGEWVDSKATQFFDIHDPSTQRVLTRVPQATQEELKRTAETAHEAWLSWRESSVLTRQRFVMELQALIRQNMDVIARSITLEQGKTFADAKGDVLRGLQVVESACAIPTLLMGDKLEVSKDMDTYTRKMPLGVGAAIAPFNFPAMIPLWSIPMALATGNTLILKPSERDPGASAIIAELVERAGLPKGCLSIVHGGVDTVNFLCDEPLIKAVTFVGSDRAGKHIYDRAGANGKRYHCILMPDASPNHALNSVAGAAFGAAGQRCMALSVLVTVGKSQDWVGELVDRAKALKLGNGFDESTDLGPVISPQAKERIEGLIESCEKEGGKILLDGRGAKVDGYPDGNWVGPTILQCTPDMTCYQEEIFGPILCVVQTESFGQALEVINKNRCAFFRSTFRIVALTLRFDGNGASIFTQSGATARKFERNVEAGQIGINAPIPVPLPMFAWSGNKGSVLGPTSLYGKLGIEFWTSLRTTTALWRSEDALTSRADVAMPTQR